MRYRLLAADGKAGIVVGNSGTVLTTDDGGVSWVSRSSGTSTNLNSVSLAADGEAGIAVGNNGTILTTVESGAVWTSRSSSTSNDLSSVALTADGKESIAVGSRSTIVNSRATDAPDTRIRETIEAQIANDDSAIEHVPRIYRDDFRKSITRRNDLEKEREILLQQIRGLESGVQNVQGSDDSKATTWEITTSTNSIRIGILVSVLFLVQILVSLSRYNTRLAGFYSARADALAILVPNSSFRDSIDMETMERLTQLLSPDWLDFGKNPTSAAMQAVETLRSRVKKKDTLGTR